MARKPQSRKTAKKRGGVHRRKTISKRAVRGGGLGISHGLAPADPWKRSSYDYNGKDGSLVYIYDSNGEIVRYGNLVEMEQIKVATNINMTKNNNLGKYFFVGLYGPNEWSKYNLPLFMSFPYRKKDENDNIYKACVKILKLTHRDSAKVSGYKFTKILYEPIIVVSETDELIETVNIDPIVFFNNCNEAYKNNYRDYIKAPFANEYIRENYIEKYQIYGWSHGDKIVNSWDDFLRDVNATITEYNKNTKETKEYIFKDGVKVEKKPEDIPPPTTATTEHDTAITEHANL